MLRGRHNKVVHMSDVPVSCFICMAHEHTIGAFLKLWFRASSKVLRWIWGVSRWLQGQRKISLQSFCHFCFFLRNLGECIALKNLQTKRPEKKSHFFVTTHTTLHLQNECWGMDIALFLRCHKPKNVSNVFGCLLAAPHFDKIRSHASQHAIQTQEPSAERLRITGFLWDFDKEWKEVQYQVHSHHDIIRKSFRYWFSHYQNITARFFHCSAGRGKTRGSSFSLGVALQPCLLAIYESNQRSCISACHMSFSVCCLRVSFSKIWFENWEGEETTIVQNCLQLDFMRLVFVSAVFKMTLWDEARR